MATFAPKHILYLTTLLLVTIVSQSKAALNASYYSQTCPQAENIILQTVYNASIFDPKVPARLLRIKANKIKKIQDKHGTLVNKDEDIENNIFTSVGENNEALEQVLATIDPSVADSMNFKLICPFVADEVWAAIQSMGPDKNPRQDGIENLDGKSILNQ
ncbi:hypothetical protein TorRG33x02_161030, partial [Trema orientale]